MIPQPRAPQARGLRYRTLSQDPAQLAKQAVENFRHLQTLINGQLALTVETVQFSAKGDGAFEPGFSSGFSGGFATSIIPLRVGDRDTPPLGLVCIRAYETKRPDVSPDITSAVLNMVWRGDSRTLAFGEPGGLTADTSYTLNVLIIG